MNENAESMAFIEPQDLRDARVVRLLPTWAGPIRDQADGPGAITLTAAPTASISSMTVRRERRGIGRYLTKSKVLLLNDEADRDAAMRAIKLAGFEVLAPLADYVASQPHFLGEPNAIGAWGNVIGFKAEVRARQISAQVALVDLDTRELFCISDELKPSILARLARMGVEIVVSHPPSPVSKYLVNVENQAEKLNSKLHWYTLDWELTFADQERMMRHGDGESLRAQLRADLQAKPLAHAKVAATTEVARLVSIEVAREIPLEIVAALEEQLREAPRDRLLVRSGKGSMYWESQNGVPDAEDIAAFRQLAPDNVGLPDDWDVCWEMAAKLSPPHAPSICALYLHDLYPDWWDALPLLPYRSAGTWLLGHSMSNPKWLRGDQTLEQKRRLQCAVALVVEAVGDDVRKLRKASREKVVCSFCSRSYEIGMLQAGEIYQRNTARICNGCGGVPGVRGTGVVWPSSERYLTPVQRDGILAAIRWYTEMAGGVISAEMLGGIEFPADLSDEAVFILRRPLPAFVTSNWVEWLGRSGVLGEEAWRPSFGQISVAVDGHACRSLLERVIDDFFSANGIAHKLEPSYPYDDTLNQHGLRADWQLADGTFVEAAGMLAAPKYAAKMERKKMLARQHDIKLILVEDADLTTMRTTFSSYM